MHYYVIRNVTLRWFKNCRVQKIAKYVINGCTYVFAKVKANTVDYIYKIIIFYSIHLHKMWKSLISSLHMYVWIVWFQIAHVRNWATELFISGILCKQFNAFFHLQIASLTTSLGIPMPSWFVAVIIMVTLSM